MINIIKRYDRLLVLMAGALMTFFTIYAKFNNMFADTEALKIRVAAMADSSERVTISLEKQVLIDQRQNEILNDLKQQLEKTWRSR